MSKYIIFAYVASNFLPHILWCPNSWWAALVVSCCKYGRIVNWWEAGKLGECSLSFECSPNLWFLNICANHNQSFNYHAQERSFIYSSVETLMVRFCHWGVAGCGKLNLMCLVLGARNFCFSYYELQPSIECFWARIVVWHRKKQYFLEVLMHTILMM